MTGEILGDWNTNFPNWPNPIALAPAVQDIVGLGPRTQQEAAFARYCDELPKIGLHVHLEAAVSSDFYGKLNEESQRFAPDQLPSRRAPFVDFRQFIRGWVDQTLLIRSPSDLYQMAKNFVEHRRSLHIVYTEAHISPSDFCMIRQRLGIPGPVFDFATRVRAYVAGVKEAQRESPNHVVRLIVDCLWPSTEEERSSVLLALRGILSSRDNLDHCGHPIIVGVGLGGPEISEAARAIRPFIDDCRELGLKVDIHSGEMTDAKAHRHSVETIVPDRVGHGFTGAVEDFFAPCPIIVCPLSNIMTGAWSGQFMDHPIKEMAARDLVYSVGSDDPLLFGNSLVLEYVALANAFGWDEKCIQRLTSNAAVAAFAPEALGRVWR